MSTEILWTNLLFGFVFASLMTGIWTEKLSWLKTFEFLLVFGLYEAGRSFG